ncbi:MAG: tripartite tricarboxylate transporter permease [bacterium]
MVESIGIALDDFFTLQSLLYLGIGAVIGMTFALIPGLGGVTAIALLIPLTYGMESHLAITMAGGVIGADSFTGSISSILLNTPGTAVNAATCFDGYPLAQKGQAGMAIGAAATASALGAVFGVVVLTAVIPIAREIVLLFGPPEFFLLALLGLSSIAVAAYGKLLRGMLMGGLGFGLAFVGFDEVSGEIRYALGLEYLWDGVKLVPVLIGLFAIAEMIHLSVKGGTVASLQSNLKIHGVFAGVKAVFNNFPTLLRGSAIGAFVGALPGVGGAVASFLSYSVTVQLSKDPESFGKGNIKGVIAPESSNNAKDGGSLIPTLAFGIPGSAETAVFLGLLVLHGLQPGPTLLIEHGEVIFNLIFALAFASIFASAVGLLCAKYLARLTMVNVYILTSVVPVIALVGAYSINSSIGDVVVAVLAGIFGYLTIRYDYPRLTFVIALVLGEIAERSFHQSMMMSDGAWSIFATRNVSVVLLVLIVLSLLFPGLRRLLRGR